MKYNEIIENITNSIITETKKLISKSKFDRTFKAKIVRQTSVDKCYVTFKGKEYLAKTGDYYSIDSIVRVCAPENNWDELYVEEPATDFHFLNPCNSLNDFVAKTAQGNLCGNARIKDTTGWLPEGANWYRIRYSYQNVHNNKTQGLAGLIEAYNQGSNIYYGIVSGSTTPYSVIWYKNNMTAI